MKSYSQFGEDAWLVLNPPFDFEGNHSFCEVGAFDGVQSSNTLLFEELFGWQGVCVEPSLKPFYECQKNRKAVCLHYAIGTQTGNGTFYLHPSDPGRGSLLPMDNGKSVGCVTMTLADAWKLVGLPGPDLLSIDTEGTELDVWASRGTLEPRIVIIEYLQWGSDEKKQPICQQLDKDGYKVVRCTEANLIFVKK